MPIDYLVIGHITQDLTLNGPLPGGTAAYAALTARALGLRVGIVTSMGPEAELGPVSDILTTCIPAETSSTFENVYTPDGRIQHIRGIARPLDFSAIPPAWRSAPIVHLGPVAREVDPKMVGQFPDALVGLTPQGWLRQWDDRGLISRAAWDQAEETLRQASATVLSIEDVQGDENTVEAIINACPVTVITEAARGSRIYWNTHLRRIPAPPQVELDPTGAGDIYAAAFFIRLHETRDPYEAGRFATRLASTSVTRRGLGGAPIAPAGHRIHDARYMIQDT